ncbi:transglycosylase SLT domain-containing protein [Pseudomonas sp. FP1740]|uniref:transglycosylase SLT domain-containing protein n=1 Tax=Pseudomonas sp. FP1740 TaxID=2954078 RepID=UPI0027349EF2|nr:transglycosylase SLT domain-containing protein [Pseudomonas sp. FP1740]WLG43213.1 transglycosylase SLT domain-containing protein [Pseudomonas sp. FP1740]
MSLSVNGGSAFIPQNLTPHEHSATAGQHGQNDLATFFLFAGGNGGAVNFAPPSSRIEGANEGSRFVIHNRSVQSPANETDAGGIQEVISLLQSLLQALLRLLGGNNSNDGGSGSGSPSGESGGSSSPSGSHNSYTPQNLAAQPSNGAPKTQGGDGAARMANVGNGPKGMPQELWKDCVNAGNKFGVDPFVLAAQSKQESNFGKDLSGASGGDGVMQVEPSTRAAYAGQFQERMGHAYNHGRQSDQVAMAALIMGSKGGDTTAQLQKYNGGDNWKPGATDSYGRVIKANEYAASVKNIAQQLRNSVA